MLFWICDAIHNTLRCSLVKARLTHGRMSHNTCPCKYVHFSESYSEDGLRFTRGYVIMFLPYIGTSSCTQVIIHVGLCSNLTEAVFIFRV